MMSNLDYKNSRVVKSLIESLDSHEKNYGEMREMFEVMGEGS